MKLFTKEKIIGKIIEIPIDKIVPNPNQPRKYFDEDELKALSESISENGIIQPITVRENNDTYEIIAGERRYRGALIAGFECVPCIIVDADESESAVMALVENIQRKNLNFFDEALAIKNMIDVFGLTQEETAKKLGKTQSTIANKLRILRFSDVEKNLITEYKLTERHARALLSVDDENLRKIIIEKIYKQNLNVTQTEKLIDTMLLKEKKNNKIRKRSKLLKHLSLFTNSINRAVDIMEASGVECSTKKVKGDGYVEFIVRISTDEIPE